MKNFKVLKVIISIDYKEIPDLELMKQIEEEVFINSNDIHPDHIEIIKTYNLLLSHIKFLKIDKSEDMDKIILYLTNKKFILLNDLL